MANQAIALEKTHSPSTPKSRTQTESGSEVRSGCGQIIKRIGQAAVVAMLGVTTSFGLGRKAPQEIPFRHEGESFRISDLTFREKISQLMQGSAYRSRNFYWVDSVLTNKKVSHAIDFTDWATDWLKSSENIGGVHLYRSDARNLEETSRTITELMAKSKIPPFVSMDIVGGYTRHLGVKRAELQKYGVPEEFLKLADADKIELPSQESLGKAYLKLKTPREKIEFRLKMEIYGEAIAGLCRDLGITVNFAPVLDLVDNVDGKAFEEVNDESYSDKYPVIQVLGFHYLKGFQRRNDVIISPKHFVGTGKIVTNPHLDEPAKVTTMKVDDGSVLPFEDAINGHLYHLQILKQNDPFEFDLRHCLFRSEYFSSPECRNFFTANNIANLGLAPNQSLVMPRVPGMMVGHAQNVINPDTPGTLSKEIIHRRLQRNLEFTGITWTDDLGMGAITRQYGDNCDNVAEVYEQSLAAGSTMPMVLHDSRCIDEMAARVQKAIDTREDANKDGKPDITIDEINSRVKKVLDEKTRIGLLSAAARSGARGSQETVYTNTARRYMGGTMLGRTK